jgi:hypothetical protein
LAIALFGNRSVVQDENLLAEQQYVRTATPTTRRRRHEALPVGEAGTPASQGPSAQSPIIGYTIHVVAFQGLEQDHWISLRWGRY